MSDSIKTIAILGGTGDLGGGLARQWSRAGLHHRYRQSDPRERAGGRSGPLWPSSPTST